MLGFEAAMPQFEALGAQVVGVSTDPGPSLAAWQKTNNAGGKQILLSDFPRRQMLTAYGALETNAQSPVRTTTATGFAKSGSTVSEK